MIKVFYSDITNLPDNPSIDEFCQDRKEYVRTITSVSRRKQSVYVWKLLLKSLNLLGISAKNGFLVNQGKWALKDNDYKFSLSHSKNLVVVAISNYEVGVDVEIFSDKLLRVSKKIFPSQKIATDKIQMNIYGRLWTKKECEIKNPTKKQIFFSYEIKDRLNNRYIIGITSNEKARLEQVNIG